MSFVPFLFAFFLSFLFFFFFFILICWVPDGDGGLGDEVVGVGAGHWGVAELKLDHEHKERTGHKPDAIADCGLVKERGVAALVGGRGNGLGCALLGLRRRGSGSSKRVNHLHGQVERHVVRQAAARRIVGLEVGFDGVPAQDLVQVFALGVEGVGLGVAVARAPKHAWVAVGHGQQQLHRLVGMVLYLVAQLGVFFFCLMLGGGGMKKKSEQWQ